MTNPTVWHNFDVRSGTTPPSIMTPALPHDAADPAMLVFGLITPPTGGGQTFTVYDDDSKLTPSATPFPISGGGKPSHAFGDILFAYTSPFLIILGLVGNLVSLIVFSIGPRSSKVTRTQYLLCLGLSDSVVLLSYVLPEWIKRGIATIDPSSSYLSNIVYDSWRCYALLFFSYSSRFISAWLRVLFTFERFYSIRFPFRRLTFANKVTRIFISVTIFCGLTLSSLKPTLMTPNLHLELYTASRAGSSGYDYHDNYGFDITKAFPPTTPPLSPMTTSPQTRRHKLNSTTRLLHYYQTTPSAALVIPEKISVNAYDFVDSFGLVVPKILPKLTTSMPPTTRRHRISTRSLQTTKLKINGSRVTSIPQTKLLKTTTIKTFAPTTVPTVTLLLSTQTQVDQNMLEALLKAFGDGGQKSNNETGDDFLSAAARPNPICVVRPEYRRLGELYDTLYFGIFIMLLPFLLIIVFDFNVLYVVRNRKTQMLTSTSTPSQTANNTRKNSMSTSPSYTTGLSHSSGIPRILSAVGTSSLMPDKLTVMLVLSSCFILLNLPYFIVWLSYSQFIQPAQTTQANAKFSELSNLPTDIFSNLSFAARAISSLTYSVNGLIYLISDRAFRDDFVSLIKSCCSKRRARQNSNAITSMASRQSAAYASTMMIHHRPFVGRLASSAATLPRGSLQCGNGGVGESIAITADQLPLYSIAQHQRSLSIPHDATSAIRRKSAPSDFLEKYGALPENC